MALAIANVRLGHACNSSSSHSMLLLPAGYRGSDSHDPGGEYGWSNFELYSRDAKAGYFAQQLYGSLSEVVGAAHAAKIVADLCGATPEGDGYVDHQSVWSWPTQWDGRGVDLDFAAAMWRRVARDDVAIFGGNDNSDYDDQWAPGPELPLLANTETDQRKSALVARNEGAGWWTVFSRRTGAKIRFNADGNAPVMTRGKAPDLVDVKITSACPFVALPCHKYCYQGSGPDQPHAEYSYLRGVARKLGAMRVFEVAIGGGEPTGHPEFADILRLFADEHILPNFTTRNYGWLADEDNRALLSETGSAVACTVSTAKDVAAVKRATGDNVSRLSLQIVEGTIPPAALVQLLEAIPRWWRVTVLGYKHAGAGIGRKPNGPAGADLLRAVCDAHYNVAIDTALARNIGADALAEFSLPVAWDAREGAFSCYVDAVTKRLAPSSYSPESAYIALEDGWRLDTAFGRLTVEDGAP